MRWCPQSIPICTFMADNQHMTGKKHTTKLVEEKSGLMECLVCGEKYHTTMKADAEGKFHPENWECVNKCRLIPHDEKQAHRK